MQGPIPKDFDPEAISGDCSVFVENEFTPEPLEVSVNGQTTVDDLLIHVINELSLPLLFTERLRLLINKKLVWMRRTRLRDLKVHPGDTLVLMSSKT
jgi:hypothetical protein